MAFERPGGVASSPAERPWDLIDLFCGCGGASAGFAATGMYEHVYAADLDPAAVETFTANLGHRPELVDLGAVASSGELDAWARTVRPDRDRPLALLGCAPCQGFSSHVKMKGDSRGRNSLLISLAHLAKAMRPDALFIENVPDLLAERHWEIFEATREILTDAGYEVRARIVNFAQLGVPQERFRAVVLARLDGRPTYPEVRCPHPRDYSTVKEWIADLPPLEAGESDSQDPMHQTSKHRRETVDILKKVPADGGRRPVGVGPKCLDEARASHGGYTDVYGRLGWSEPAPTITARCRTPSCGRFAHPEQHRGLTAREAALLQTFPREWQFVGPFDDRFKQIGNAVPPLAAMAFAEHIAAGWPDSSVEVGLEDVTQPVGKSFSVLIPGLRRRAAQA